jgi:hypothetical protein
MDCNLCKCVTIQVSSSSSDSSSSGGSSSSSGNSSSSGSSSSTPCDPTIYTFGTCEEACGPAGTVHFVTAADCSVYQLGGGRCSQQGGTNCSLGQEGCEQFIPFIIAGQPDTCACCL